MVLAPPTSRVAQGWIKERPRSGRAPRDRRSVPQTHTVVEARLAGYPLAWSGPASGLAAVAWRASM